MTPEEVVFRLRAIGYELVPEPDGLSYAWTRATPPPPEAATLLHELARHGREVLALLRVAEVLKRGVQQPKALGDLRSCPSVALLQQQGGIPPSPVAPPSPAGGITLALSLQPDGTCWCCKGSRWWLSIYGVLVCATCHPPAVPELVARYVDGEEATRLARA